MADNVAITAGAGTNIATDDVASVHYQVMKIGLGADGAIDTLVDSGQQTMANSIPITIASDQTDVKITLDSEAVVLGAGSAGIGKLTANAGVTIGAVELVAAQTLGTVSILTGGGVAHDADATGVKPLLVGGYSSAAAPTSVSADSEAVNAWFLRNGAQATVITAAGALVDGDATNGLDVDVTRVKPDGTNTMPSLDTAARAGHVIVDAGTGGGATTMNASSSDGGTALTSTAQVIKASAGILMGYYIYNPNSTAQFVQLYNTAAASVTVGTTNPLFMLTIPAGSAANLWTPGGITFGTAMSWAATSTAGGNGAPTTALDAVAWYV
jgi:hypothetical protein